MSDFDPTTATADKTIDARGVACPGPLLEAKKGIGKVPVGGIIEILSSDPSTRNDLPVWVKKVKHEYLGDVTEDNYFRMFIRRKK